MKSLYRPKQIYVSNKTLPLSDIKSATEHEAQQNYNKEINTIQSMINKLDQNKCNLNQASMTQRSPKSRSKQKLSRML